MKIPRSTPRILTLKGNVFPATGRPNANLAFYGLYRSSGLILAQSIMPYNSLPINERQINLQRVACIKTPNPLSRKFQGPKFLDNGQIIEVRNEKEAFRCSNILHDLFISSSVVMNMSKDACCSAANGPSSLCGVTTVAAIQDSPFRSIYLNERSLTITLNGNYVKNQMRGISDVTEEAANAIWEKLTPALLAIIEGKIESSQRNDNANSYTGSVNVLDKINETDNSETVMHSLWATANEDTDISCDDSEPTMAVKELIRQRVKPLLEQDGGSCRFVGMVEEGDSFYADIIKNKPHVVSSDTEDPFTEMTLEVGSVLLLLEGACVGCPSSSFTLKNGVQRMLTHWVSEVKHVVEVDEEFAQGILSERRRLKEQRKKGPAPHM